MQGRTKHKDRPEQPAKLADYVVTHISAGPNSTAAVTGTCFLFIDLLFIIYSTFINSFISSKNR